MNIIAHHTVPNELQEKTRLSDYLCGIFEQLPSRKSVKKAIKNKRVFVDNIAADTSLWVIPNMQIELLEKVEKAKPIFKLDIEVIYEDEWIAVVNKPAGHMVSGNSFQTIENALLHNIHISTQSDALVQPRVVHRLDTNTRGILVVAKTQKARMLLGQQFEQKTVQKQYQAIVIGQLETSEGNIDIPIQEKSAFTAYKVLQTVPSVKYGHLSLVDLFPSTGRRHQLRIHLSQLGHPILGDKEYGNEGQILRGKGIFLFAKSIRFVHPIREEELFFSLELPNKYQLTLAK